MCPHNMANFGPLTAEICWRVWGTPESLNGFRVLPSLLQRRRSSEANQTAWCLAISWAATLYIHFREILPFVKILPGAKFTLRLSLAFLYIGSVTALHSSSGRQPNCGVVEGMELLNFRRGRHLYLAGWPSRWASAYIRLVMAALYVLAIYIFIFVVSSFFFPRLISAVGDWMSAILPHMVWP